MGKNRVMTQCLKLQGTSSDSFHSTSRKLFFNIPFVEVSRCFCNYVAISNLIKAFVISDNVFSLTFRRQFESEICHTISIIYNIAIMI